MGPEWACLHDNRLPSATEPTVFYTHILSSLQSLVIPSGFSFSSKAFYPLLLEAFYTPAILPGFWTPFIPSRFSLSHQLEFVCDGFTENFENDLAWLITLRAVKVRRSLCNWGYISSPCCALSPRAETLDHSFLHFPRVKRGQAPFHLHVRLFFYMCSPTPTSKNLRILLYILKTVLCGVWKFRNKATF